jgi:hypothetical protein
MRHCSWFVVRPGLSCHDKWPSRRCFGCLKNGCPWSCPALPRIDVRAALPSVRRMPLNKSHVNSYGSCFQKLWLPEARHLAVTHSGFHLKRQAFGLQNLPCIESLSLFVQIFIGYGFRYPPRVFPTLSASASPCLHGENPPAFHFRRYMAIAALMAISSNPRSSAFISGKVSPLIFPTPSSS